MCDNKMNLRSLQVQFIQWLVKWSSEGEDLQPVHADLPEVVPLLQCLGYKVTRIDACSPDQISPLRNGKKGTRVIVTCGHSGQRCFLELPEDQNKCNCLIKKDAGGDNFWEVTSTVQSSSMIESGSDLLPELTRDLQAFIRNIMHCLIHFLHGNITELKKNSSATSSPKENAKRISSFMKDIVGKDLMSSDKIHSPTRYRSLDHLPGANAEIPDPSPLSKCKLGNSTKTISIHHSSPNIKIAVQDNSDESTATIKENKNEVVVTLLTEALKILQEKPTNQIPSKSVNQNKIFLEKDMQHHNEQVVFRSSSNLIQKTTPKVQMTKVASLNKLSGSVPKLQSKLSSGLNLKLKKLTEPKPVSKPSAGVSETKNYKRTNLYGHVKSTIPKPTNK